MKFYILLTLLVLIRDVINWSIFYQVCRNEFKELYDYLPTYRQYQLLEIKNNYDKTNNKEKNIRKKDKPNIKQNNKEDEQINLLFQEYFIAISLCVTEAYNNYMKNNKTMSTVIIYIYARNCILLYIIKPSIP